MVEGRAGLMVVFSFCLAFLWLWEYVCLKARWGETSELSLALGDGT